MSKYILEIKPDYEGITKSIMILGAKEDNLFVDTIAVENLEELNSDYINEHFGDLQDTAYQRGLEDGKAVHDKGCEGCRYECENKRRVPCILCSDNIKLPSTISPSKLKSQWTAKGDEGCKYAGSPQGSSPCFNCSNYYQNNWTAKDDKIEVGDIIANNTEPKLKVWVTCFDEIGFCGIAITDFGTVDGGKLYSSCSPKGWHKIGHFDIAKILEDMRHD